MRLAQDIRQMSPTLWVNASGRDPSGDPRFDCHRFQDACDLWEEMQPLLAGLFPQIGPSGRIHSDLKALTRDTHPTLAPLPGTYYLKQDHALPVAGSIKARGGFFEIICHARDIAMANGLMTSDDPLKTLLAPETRGVFQEHLVSVGSTGNLALSIGLIASALGFRVEAHMSREAKSWKKQRLRDEGVSVIEHAADYLTAVHAACAAAKTDPRSYFVDDEHSEKLFLGYSAAAKELAGQISKRGHRIGPETPLFVYLPSGIGGAPGGITFGLKQLFGEYVHCFFAEPVAAPCMLVQLMGGNCERRSVYDYGLDGRTEADGLAVSHASPLVAGLMEHLLSGVYTVTDAQLLADVKWLLESQGEFVEPSAAAGLSGPPTLFTNPGGRDYIDRYCPDFAQERAVHVIWTTGGRLVPDDQRQKWLSAAEVRGSEHVV